MLVSSSTKTHKKAVVEPTIPGYLWQNPTDIHTLVDDDIISCQRTMQTYKTIRTDSKKNRARNVWGKCKVAVSLRPGSVKAKETW
jgi:hypothetical protein